MKKYHLLIAGLFCLFTSAIQSQPVRTMMHSNQRVIKMFINDGENDWTIEPATNPDVLNLYHAKRETYFIKFISDIDSLIFDVKVNEPVYFDIIYKGDTAHSTIDFTNRMAAKLSDSDKLQALGLFWSEAKYNFSFIDKLTFDLDSLYKVFIPKVLATANDYEFYDVMQLFAGALHDGHTQVRYYAGSQYTEYIPMLARYFNDELFIVEVSESLASTFPVGSKITGINGLKTEEYMTRYIEPYITSDFKPTVQRLAASALLSGKLPSDTLVITYETPEKKTLTHILPRDGSERANEPAVGYRTPYREKTIEILWKENDIAVLEFNTFNDQNGNLQARFDQLKDTLYHAAGIVIDLRYNGGGSTAVAWHLLQYIIKDPYFLNFAWQTRINDGVRKAQGNFRKEYEDFYKNAAYRTVPADTVYIPDSIRRFNVPIAILFSTNTVSAAEDFLIILAERPDRPLFIGQPSFGSTGSPLMVWGFPSGSFARICARRVLFPYSMKPFTEGIQPDILVDYTFDEFISGKDKDMEVAVRELQKQIRKQKK